MNVGPIPLRGLIGPLSDCGAPTRGALRWVTGASRASMYDMSTYRHRPGAVDGVASIEAHYAGRAPEPLAAAAAGLRACDASGREIAITSGLGVHAAIRYTLGPPKHSVVTLVSEQRGDTVVAVAVSRPAATPARYLRAGLLAGERTVIDLALKRAGARH
jgi:hypothetical protein